MAAELDFTLSLVDKLTKPLKQAQSALTGFADKATADFKRIGGGALALWGVNKALMGMMRPAYDLQDALDDSVGSGYAAAGLDKLTKAANSFAIEYGRSSLEFVKNSTLIRRSIGGITDNDLPAYTHAASVLGVAMRTGTEDAVNYLSHMTNLMPQMVKKMGSVDFAGAMAGLASQMKNSFNSSLNDISAMIEQSKGTGSAYGVSLAEQLGTMGTASQVLGSGASAGYDQLLRHLGSGDATKATGINFRDAQGQILPIMSILDKLKAKYGENIEGNARAQAAMEKAFGKGASVIRALWNNADGLSKSINALGKNPGLKAVEEMAKKTVVPWEQFAAILEAIRAEISLRLLPTFGPFFDALVDCGKEFVNWLHAFPNIARWIGYIVVSMISLAAIGATVAIIMGIISLIKLGAEASGSIKLLKYTLDLLRPSLISTRIGLMGLWIQEKAVWVWSKLVALWAGICKVAIAAWNVVLRTCTVAMRLFGIAARFAGMGLGFLLSPIGLILLAIAALAAGIYFAIKYWDDIKAAIMDTQAFKWLQSAIAPVVDWFNDAWKSIEDGWNNLTNWFKNFSLADSFGNITAGIGKLFDGIWDAIKKTFLGTWNWIVEKLNVIPGVNISTVQQNVAPTPQPALITGNRAAAIPGGPVSSQISNSRSEKVVYNDNKPNITINVDQMPTPGAMAEWNELAAG
ncbi:phage tail tape measure protein [Salmonella enterica]|uniref:Phage tail tape measure protein n=1 Tax=Salmonella enterica TaxID=28901 RepID=A0A5V2R099_SALER|nr:phage tail tape measure protein [Salmonella enterica]ECD9501394.1 phage tail tape measure protein [Salmonella enterica subsp. diarizonae]ECF1922349.1 phage tail tape measure protein [Salmonella enterica subsp. enterica serovar Newport]ECK9472905.1 phage tail tape measure protein [Salmonella enterica subsp. enterica serovar Dublin str. CFSAN000518]EEA8039563.1 phage tail tape measure protein [Salmonella enterica subsp. enterica]EEL9492730.1 phage tail tape measure protein [Salmonella enteric